jgi:hypothetical protein
MQPLTVEVITYAPTQYFHCQHCELVWNQAQMDSVQKFHADAQATSIPPELMQEYRALSDWIIQCARRYGERVRFRIVDAASIEGVWKSLRYGVHRYPAFVIAGKEKLTGNDFARVEARIQQRLASQPA